MKFEDIEFSVRHGRYGPSVGLLMGRHWVFKHIVEETWERVSATYPMLEWHKPQTARVLFDDPDWNNRGFGRRIAIGRCLRHFVDHEMLPLYVVNPKASGTKQYLRLNP